MGGMYGYGDLTHLMNIWKPPQHYRLEKFCQEKKGSYETNFLKGIPNQTKKVKKLKGKRK